MQYCMRSRRMHSNSAKEQHYSYQSINNPIFPTPYLSNQAPRVDRRPG
jgi:hypothetical protein